MASRNSISSPDQLLLFDDTSYERDDPSRLIVRRSWGVKFGSYLACQDCGATCVRRSTQQKFCGTCAVNHDRQRKNEWSKKNPRPKHQIKKYTARKLERLRRVGDAMPRDDRWTIANLIPDESRFSWVRRVSVPFDLALSKNFKYKVRGVNQESRPERTMKVRRSLSDLVSESIRDAPVVKGKILIDMLVQKPDHTTDAINMVDHISDALKVAIGVDDRWFSYLRIDWQIIKSNPQILLGIAQDISVDHQACSYCGRLLTFDCFYRRTNTPNGIGRECKNCSRNYSLERAPERKESRKKAR